MGFTFETISVDSSYGITVNNTLIAQDPPQRKLLVMLPGRGYTVDAPLFHYLRAAALERGFDVLMVRYGFQLSQDDFSYDQLPALHQESLAAVQQAMQRGYDSVVIAGKSLGSPLAGPIAQAITAEKRAVILLTPIRDSVALAGKLRTLAVIGTADGAYVPDSVQDTETCTWKVYDDLNHGLEYPADWRRSLPIMTKVINECDLFLEDG